jgi:hypothetical protein
VLASAFLFSSGCAKQDPAYQQAMDDWASKSCACSRLPTNKDQQACYAGLTKPERPRHLLDRAMTNPNHEIAQRAEDQVRKCSSVVR